MNGRDPSAQNAVSELNSAAFARLVILQTLVFCQPIRFHSNVPCPETIPRPAHAIVAVLFAYSEGDPEGSRDRLAP
ncbi:MAG: hypothetical protein ABIO35_09015, partial [Nitrobacter sp.]